MACPLPQQWSGKQKILVGETMSTKIPVQEVQALEVLYDACGGESWVWRRDQVTYGVKWNFAVDELTGELLNNPCSSSNTDMAGSHLLSSPQSVQQSDLQCDRTRSWFSTTWLGTIPLELGNMTNLDILFLNS